MGSDHEHGMLNDGELVEAGPGATFENVDPATEESVNGAGPHGADMPFGGYKHSGVGRQNGTAGFYQYLEVESVAWPAG